MRSRILVLVVALALGGVAAFMAASYLRSARSDIAAQAETVAVLIAQKDLPRGMTVEQLKQEELVVTREIPRQFVSMDAMSSFRGAEDQVLAVPVATGEQLTRGRFQYPAEAGLSYSVPAQYVAIACEVDEVSGVGGLLRPGDQVMVFATLQTGARGREERTLVVIPVARVLAVGATVGTQAGDDEDQDGGGALGGGQSRSQGLARTVTLALAADEAARLTYAQETGSVRLALLPASGAQAAVPGPVTISNIAK